MKFLADHMLGRLARWLRLFGFDTLYPDALPDKELVDIAKMENRILLTRDKTLANSKYVQTILIDSVNIDKQLEQIVNDANLKIENPFSRCTVCNGLIEIVEKYRVRDDVPPKVYDYCDEFWRCLNCSKVYWKGSHWEKISAEIIKYKND